MVCIEVYPYSTFVPKFLTDVIVDFHSNLIQNTSGLGSATKLNLFPSQTYKPHRNNNHIIYTVYIYIYPKEPRGPYFSGPSHCVNMTAIKFYRFKVNALPDKSNRPTVPISDVFFRLIPTSSPKTSKFNCFFFKEIKFKR